MKKIILFLTLLSIGATAQNQSVSFKKNDAEKKIDVLIGGKYFTSYFYPGESVLKKAVLFPILSAKGRYVVKL